MYKFRSKWCVLFTGGYGIGQGPQETAVPAALDAPAQQPVEILLARVVVVLHHREPAVFRLKEHARQVPDRLHLVDAEGKQIWVPWEA